MTIFPKRQWKSSLLAFSAGVRAGEPDAAQVGIPLPGPLVTSFEFSPSVASLSVGVPATLTPTVAPAGAVRKFYLSGGPLPAGLSMSDSTGVISGTPTAPKAATVYRVLGDAAYTYEARITITVT